MWFQKFWLQIETIQIFLQSGCFILLTPLFASQLVQVQHVSKSALGDLGLIVSQTSKNEFLLCASSTCSHTLDAVKTAQEAMERNFALVATVPLTEGCDAGHQSGRRDEEPLTRSLSLLKVTEVQLKRLGGSQPLCSSQWRTAVPA